MDETGILGSYSHEDRDRAGKPTARVPKAAHEKIFFWHKAFTAVPVFSNLAIL